MINWSIESDARYMLYEGDRADGRGRQGGNYLDPLTPTGIIAISSRLAVALRVHDLAANYEISRVEVMTSVWAVVEAVNQNPEFHILYPADHAVQR